MGGRLLAVALGALALGGCASSSEGQVRRAVAEEFAEQGYISVPVGDVHLHADYATVEVGKSVAVVELGESGWRMIALRTTKTSR